MELVVVSICGVIGLGVWWKANRESYQKSSKVIQEQPIQHHPYAAVQLCPCINSCESARWVSKKTFLATELNHLPIENCDRVEACDCKFKHLADRRHQEDRRSFSYIFQDVFQAEEHRDMKKRGRRKNDVALG